MSRLIFLLLLMISPFVHATTSDDTSAELDVKCYEYLRVQNKEEAREFLQKNPKCVNHRFNGSTTLLAQMAISWKSHTAAAPEIDWLPLVDALLEAGANPNVYEPKFGPLTLQRFVGTNDEALSKIFAVTKPELIEANACRLLNESVQLKLMSAFRFFQSKGLMYRKTRCLVPKIMDLVEFLPEGDLLRLLERIRPFLRTPPLLEDGPLSEDDGPLEWALYGKKNRLAIWLLHSGVGLPYQIHVGDRLNRVPLAATLILLKKDEELLKALAETDMRFTSNYKFGPDKVPSKIAEFGYLVLNLVNERHADPVSVKLLRKLVRSGFGVGYNPSSEFSRDVVDMFKANQLSGYDRDEASVGLDLGYNPCNGFLEPGSFVTNVKKDTIAHTLAQQRQYLLYWLSTRACDGAGGKFAKEILDEIRMTNLAIGAGESPIRDMELLENVQKAITAAEGSLRCGQRCFSSCDASLPGSCRDDSSPKISAGIYSFHLPDQLKSDIDVCDLQPVYVSNQLQEISMTKKDGRTYACDAGIYPRPRYFCKRGLQCYRCSFPYDAEKCTEEVHGGTQFFRIVGENQILINGPSREKSIPVKKEK